VSGETPHGEFWVGRTTRMVKAGKSCSTLLNLALSSGRCLSPAAAFAAAEVAARVVDPADDDDDDDDVRAVILSESPSPLVGGVKCTAGNEGTDSPNEMLATPVDGVLVLCGRGDLE